MSQIDKMSVQVILKDIDALLNLLEEVYPSASQEETTQMYALAKRMECINAAEHLRMQNLTNMLEYSGKLPVILMGGSSHGEG